MKDLKEIEINIKSLRDSFNSRLDNLQKDVEALKEKPEFKVGQWVIGNPGWSPKLPSLISYINNDRFSCDDYAGNRLCKDTWRSGSRIYIRPATASEIESHLRKIAEEKGFKSGCVADFPNGCGCRKLYGDFRYIPNWLSAEDGFAMGDNIIWRPKFGWATILPSKKNKPETREEFKEMLCEYDGWSGSINNFVDQYDI